VSASPNTASRGARLAGILALPPAVALFLLALWTGASWSGLGYTAGASIAAAGLAGRSAIRGLRLSHAGLALLAATLLVRLLFGGAGRTLSLTGAEGEGSGRLLGRVLDEGDAAVAASTVLSAGRLLQDPEPNLIPPAMRAAYARMRTAEGDIPSPLLPTYAGLQRPSAFDLLIVDGVESPRGALIFLHGFAGSFSLPCWQLAETARAAGLVTLCPATGWRGAWWEPEGRAILRRTLEIARSRGLTRIYLAGLSNGAVGAARIAPSLSGQIHGLVLVSCAPPEVPAPGVPTLVLQGRGDRMCPASLARGYAARAGARYVDLPGGHFALLTHEEEARSALASWLRAQEKR
jgi:pimeloyl-ACP methyl ester carboxylesterase